MRAIGLKPDGTPLNRQFHLDPQGSVLAITDGSQTVETSYLLDAWGNVLSGSATANRFDYLGCLGYGHGPDLGFSYVRARWLDPKSGTWLSADTLLDEARYAYAHYSPAVSVDPSGKQSLPPIDRQELFRPQDGRCWYNTTMAR